jgi:hypothetical protein
MYLHIGLHHFAGGGDGNSGGSGGSRGEGQRREFTA